MQYRHPAYQDVSHFRQPYANWPLGAEAPPSPNGATGPLTPPPEATEAAAAELLEQRDGKHYFKPEARKGALDLLSQMRAIHVGGSTERVEVVPLSEEEMAALSTPEGQASIAPFLADKWVADRTKEGKVVFAPTWIFAPIEGRELAAIPKSDEDRVKQAASTPMVGILAEPSGLSIAGIGTTGIAMGVIAIAGIGYYAYTRRQGGRGRGRGRRGGGGFR